MKTNRLPVKTIAATLSLLILLSFLLAGCQPRTSSSTGWPVITTQSKPWARWWWPGSAVNRQDLGANLKQYAAAGIGGVEITPIYGVKGYEDQFIDFLSPRWMEMLQYTTSQAHRLGMEVDMATGTGWPFGGPQITPQYAAPRLVTQTYTLTPGEHITTPIRHESQRFNRPAPLQALMAYSDEGDVLNLTSQVDSNERLSWTPPQGKWTVIAAFRGWTGQQVKRAAPGGEGNVMNHYSEAALDHYLARFDTAFAGYDNDMIRAYFNDSFEVYGSNWTGNLFEEFHTRRGYDLRDYLPALLGQGPEDIRKRVLSDYHETISDLLLEDFTIPWREWAHRHGSSVRNQAHGSPGNLLDLYGAVDIPETETIFPVHYNIPGYHTHPDFIDDPSQPNPLIMKFASSAAHVTGKTIASSETATWLDEHFKVRLSQVKPEVDDLFSAGINHIFYHGIAYSPQDEQWPGWLFYASTNFGPTNPWWDDFASLNQYIARTQSFLQSGRPDNDILVYFPIYDAWHQDQESFLRFSVHNYPDWFTGTPMQQTAQTLWDHGFSFDYISDRQLQDVQYSDATLHVGESDYHTIVLPATDHMPVETLQKIVDLAKAGATVVVAGSLPGSVPGLGHMKDRQAQLAEIVNSIDLQSSGTPGVSTAALGEGRILQGNDLPQLLAQTNAIREPLADHHLRFRRLSHPGGFLYFVANLDSQAVDTWIPLGTPAQSAMLYDPLRKRRGVAAIRQNDDGRTAAHLRLLPGESRILKTFTDRQVSGQPWQYLETQGTPVTLTGTWQIHFLKGGPAIPNDATMTQLASWTTLPGDAYKNFSGTARYSLTFTKPDLTADSWILDLGRVAESARVRLNGREVSTVWSIPFQCRVGDALKSGENTLEVEVTNLGANRIAYMDRQGINWKKFYEINFVNINYEPFDASNWQPMESGLRGPVRLIPYNVK